MKPHLVRRPMQVFPQLYLPVMEESNQRVLQPWRSFLPIPAWWAFNSRIRQLNSYIVRLLRARWAGRQRGVPTPEHPDLLDRILAAVEVRASCQTAGLRASYNVPSCRVASRWPICQAR